MTIHTSESLFKISITIYNSVGRNGMATQFEFREDGQGDIITAQTFADLLLTYEGNLRNQDCLSYSIQLN